MTENDFQNEFFNYIKIDKNTTYFGKLPLKYNTGKYYKGKDIGMPDCELDILKVDAHKEFHLYELKKIDSSELITGKVFGQIMLYDFLFTTEYANELLGRFLDKNKNKKSQIKGDIQNIISAILSKTDNNSDELLNSKAVNNFKSWNIVICGGNESDLILDNFPILYTYMTFKKRYFNSNTPKINFLHFYKDKKEFKLKQINMDKEFLDLI